jgi:GntR family transcriptional regulator
MIKINTHSFTPIYQQIKNGIKKEVFSGQLKPQAPLPSIRELATELLVNPNTVARAYRDLETEGIIYTRKGKGCYIADGSSKKMSNERNRIIIKELDAVIAEARKYGMDSATIEIFFQNRLSKLFPGKKEDK